MNELTYNEHPKQEKNINDAERVVSVAVASALISFGIKRRDGLGLLLGLAGGLLAYRGATGHCPAYSAASISNRATPNDKSPYNKGWLSGKVHVTKTVTINRSVSDLYHFWRNFENLPVFMHHLESVSTTGEKTSHWRAKAPLGYTVEWDAEVTSDIENQRIGWISTEGADIANSGVVEFLPTEDRGTVVKVVVTYEAPAGKLGALAAKLFGEEPGQQIAEDLRRFKALMETDSIIKVEGQPSGRAASA
jgi:uncharacterized membrane protein